MCVAVKKHVIACMNENTDIGAPENFTPVVCDIFLLAVSLSRSYPYKSCEEVTYVQILLQKRR